MQHTATPQEQISDLDRPRTVTELVNWLRVRGERVTSATLYRWIREGSLPAAKVGRTTTTARAYYQVRTPRMDGAA